MEEMRWWSRSLFVGALVAVVLLLAGPLGYRYGISPLLPSLVSLLLALITGAVVVGIALIMAVVAVMRKLPRNRNLLLASAALAAVPVVVMVPQIVTARSVPPIHDISTDTADPPKFVQIVALRRDAPNDLEYGSEDIPPEEAAALQRDAYPAVQTLETDLSVAAAVERAVEVLESQDVEIVTVDPQAGIVEGTATTFWFGFKDDVVVRVRPRDDGSVVDVRSVSRVGQSDVGANARRISEFLEAF